MTLRQLFWMDCGSWDKYAALAAHIANCNRDPKTSPFRAKEFHPYHCGQMRRVKGIRLTPDNMHILKAAFGV